MSEGCAVCISFIHGSVCRVIVLCVSVTESDWIEQTLFLVFCFLGGGI
jgi:hypothetical protein